MKKQFFRVKQLADQTFSRADKTQVLSDDLQDADRRVEYIRTACQKTSKLLSSGLVTQGQDPGAKDKRLKKYPEYALSLAMSESGVGGDSLLGTVLTKCGQAQMALAKEVFNLEVNVEQKVVTPLTDVLDNDIPSILKHKRNLQKLILDMDSARTRFATATKQSGGQRGESIREELGEAEQKVELCRGTLASEMFELISREAELAHSFVLHVKLQQEYHRSALGLLDELIPELEAEVQDSACKPVFHVSLEEHLRVTSRRIAFPLELCVCALLQLGTQEEGLFRVAGGSLKVRRLKLSLDAGCLDLAAAVQYGDPHVLAAALKSYLRELPEPLATHALYPQWMLAAKETEQESRLNALWAVVHQLPTANFENLRYLIKFLSELTKSQTVNKMSPQNIAIVIAPNLLWSPGEESASIGANMNMASAYTSIVDTLISFCDWFFPEPLAFYQTWDEPRDLKDEPRLGAPQVNGATARITAQDEMDYYGHVRGGSHDTVLVSLDEPTPLDRAPSTGSLSDSPPPGSPKPAARRKNKPAPGPPAAAPPSRPTQGPPTTAPPPRPAPESTTLPRPARKPLDGDTTGRGNAAVRPLERNNALRRSLDLLQDQRRTAQSGSDAALDVAKAPAEHGNNVTDSVDGKTDSARREDVDARRGIADVKKATSEAKKEFVEPRKEFAKGWKDFVEPRKDFVEPRMDFVEPRKEVVEIRRETEPRNEPVVEMRVADAKKPVEAQGAEAKRPAGAEDAHRDAPAEETSHVARVMVNCEPASSATNTSTLDRKRHGKVPPVAAPRTVGGDDDVTLRRVAGDAKPAIPERPSMLQRPNSITRTPRNSQEMDALPDAATLERIHMYCVDKQQVSIIQVGSERDEKSVQGGCERDDKTADPAAEPAHADSKSERPERPPKPEHISATPVGVASHDGAPPSPGLGGGASRPPRPQPPPPPAKPRPESDSTDL